MIEKFLWHHTSIEWMSEKSKTQRTAQVLKMLYSYFLSIDQFLNIYFIFALENFHALTTLYMYLLLVLHQATFSVSVNWFHPAASGGG